MGRGALDSALDFADSVVGGVETFYGRRAGSSSAAPNAQNAQTGATGPAQLTSGWKISTVKAKDGSAAYFVTNGSECVACSSEALAQRVCMLLGGSVP